MELKQASEDDFDRLRAFYIHVIDNTPSMGECCRWIYGMHPDDELLLTYLAAGYLYYYEREGEIIAAIAVTESQDEDYRDAPWQMALGDGEVAVGHLMCVHPAYQRQGIATMMLKDVCALSARLGKKAYRFDSLATNAPALALYDAHGFRRVCVKHWYACNIGWTDFVLFEKLLESEKY